MSRNEAIVHMNDATSATETMTPHSLVTEDNVRAALIADKGPRSRLTEWKVLDFTKKGDNYACVVSSVEVKFELDGMSSKVVYVVKLNPCTNDEISDFVNPILYEKEAKFYCSLLPELNAVLKENGQRELNVPKCLHVSLEKGKEIIYLEDLRSRGYKMHDTKRCMNTLHIDLVLRELARLHASSFLLEKKYPGKDLREKYSYLKKNYSHIIAESEHVLKFAKDSLKIAQEMLMATGGYERAVAWIDTLTPKLKDVFFDQLECGTPKVVCHGDCWNNNLLFKYNDAGHPVDVMLLDQQTIRYTPPATDLSHLLYCGTTGDFRKLNLQTSLECCHGALTDIMEAAGQEAPFDLGQLIKDLREKILCGSIFGMMVAPVAILKVADEVVSSKETYEGLDGVYQKARANVMEKLDSNPFLRPRLLSLLDELTELGILT